MKKNQIDEIVAAKNFSKYNEISASEVMLQMSVIQTQIRTLQAYILAYGRDWNENMGSLLQEVKDLAEGYDVIMFTCNELITKMALKHYRDDRR